MTVKTHIGTGEKNNGQSVPCTDKKMSNTI